MTVVWDYASTIAATATEARVSKLMLLLPEVRVIGVLSRSKCSKFISIMCWTSWQILRAEAGADSCPNESLSCGITFWWDMSARFCWSWDICWMIKITLGDCFKLKRNLCVGWYQFWAHSDLNDFTHPQRFKSVHIWAILRVTVFINAYVTSK